MKHHIWAALSALILSATASIAACSPLGLLDKLTPQTGYTAQTNIAYGDLDRQKLDVYMPEKPDANHTVVLFFYGGTWQMGDRGFYRFVGQSLASRGYMAVIADYRLYPQVYFPTFMTDAAKALRWTHDNISHYGGDAGHVYVMGHSAGAHIAMLLTLDDRYLTAVKGQKSWIKGTIGLAGPYDFLPLTDPKLKDLFGRMPLRESQPINFVAKDEPPILLLHGDADRTVGIRNSQHLAQKLAAHGNSVLFKTYHDVDHIGIAQALSVRFTGKAPSLTDIDAFIQRTNDAKP